MGWKSSGKGMEKNIKLYRNQNLTEWNGNETELEWKILRRKSRWHMLCKWKGNGMEMEWIFF